MLWWIPGSGGGTGGHRKGSLVTIASSTKQQNKHPDFLNSSHPYALQLHCRGKHLDFIDLESYHPPHFPMCWYPGIKVTGPQWRHPTHLPREHSPFSTTLWKSEKPEMCKRVKKLAMQHLLLENNSKTLYQSTREMPLIHRCLDVEGVHQIQWISKVMRHLRNKMNISRKSI